MKCYKCRSVILSCNISYKGLPTSYWAITARRWKRPQYNIQIQKLLIKLSALVLWATYTYTLEVERIKAFCWSLNFTAELLKTVLIRNCSTECWTPLRFSYKHFFFCSWFWVSLKELPSDCIMVLEGIF